MVEEFDQLLDSVAQLKADENEGRKRVIRWHERPRL